MRQVIISPNLRGVELQVVTIGADGAEATQWFTFVASASPETDRGNNDKRNSKSTQTKPGGNKGLQYD